MADNEPNFLDIFPLWLRDLGQDAVALSEVATVTALPAEAREAVVGALNYLFKSLDLIPDGIDDIGYLDDAFVLRVACDQAMREDVSTLSADTLAVLNRLAEDAQLVRTFLDDEVFARLETYVTGLRRGAARGRSVAQILEDDAVRENFVAEIGEFASSYRVPTFSRQDKNLVKLRYFFDAKLPK